MKKIVLSLMALASFLFAGQVFAHVSYYNLNVNNPSIRAVTSNIGWSDAADGDWGDSHHAAWFKFNLAEDSLVSITVSGLNAGTYASVNQNGASINVTPALNLTDVGFSLYKGLFPAGAYDSAASLPIPSGKDGRWDALGDTTMANNSAAVGTVEFKTAVNNSTDNVETLINFFLTAGDYSLGTGGAFGATGTVIDADVGDHLGSYAIQASLSVQPVPVPGAAWLFGSAVAGLIGFGRRKKIA
ncbi:MAG: hypothetical protein PHH11_02305 [Methylomonas sp.]|nr:hypothetical protein [Methylomonas sp.]